MLGEEDQAIAISPFEGVRVFTLHGEWDVSNRERLRAALTSLGNQGDVLVDLREASFFDSTALAELIALYKRLTGEGQRRLEALVGESNMRRLLELTSLDNLLGVSGVRARYLTERLPPPRAGRDVDSARPLSAHRASLERYLSEIILPVRLCRGAHHRRASSDSYARDPVRPCLLLWACAATGGDIADALPVAVAFDLFDRFMLLHDELADVGAETIVRWGLGQSLNAGDAFYALAFRSLASDVGNPACRLEVARLVGEAVLEAIEAREGAMEGRCALTGAALQAGAIIGGASADVAMTFAQAGRALGMASETNEQRRAAVRARRFAAAAVHAQSRPRLFAEVALYVARKAA